MTQSSEVYSYESYKYNICIVAYSMQKAQWTVLRKSPATQHHFKIDAILCVMMIHVQSDWQKPLMYSSFLTRFFYSWWQH